ncbi:hypothetical protein SDC9_206808 [bioreactor metagenome]|uniref:Uncharacterized protein n=1 Tax=bioreactor metagenome TaxID=1076179 RepID=A0A645J7H8_9ZZZZ
MMPHIVAINGGAFLQLPECGKLCFRQLKLRGQHIPLSLRVRLLLRFGVIEDDKYEIENGYC